MFTLVPGSSPVRAGVNGQQIGVVDCGATYIDIAGLNHRGHWKTYRLWADPNACVERVTSRWWWKGDVTLTKVDGSGLRTEIVVYVPTYQPGIDVSWYTLFPLSMGEVYVERGRHWVEKHISYYSPDNPDVQPMNYMGYRRDCSGFVSFAWQLGKSPDTTTLWQYATNVQHLQLSAGDAINDEESGAQGHVILFVRWIDFDQLKFLAYEENYSYGGAVENEYRLEWTGDGYSIPSLDMYNVAFQRKSEQLQSD